MVLDDSGIISQICPYVETRSKLLEWTLVEPIVVLVLYERDRTARPVMEKRKPSSDRCFPFANTSAQNPTRKRGIPVETDPRREIVPIAFVKRSAVIGFATRRVRKDRRCANSAGARCGAGD